jgi:ankyrin repeat protein
MKGSIDLVKCLVEKGSNTNEENHEGETPLH